MSVRTYSRCRSCSASIIWAITARGRRMPLDAKPVPGGGVQLDGDRATVIPNGGTHRPHFASCPQAAQHRRRRQDDAVLDDARREMGIDQLAGADVGAK